MKYIWLLTFLMLLLSSDKTQGSSDNQEVQQIVMKVSISFSKDKFPNGFLAGSWFHNSNATIGTHYFYGDTKMTEDFINKLNISEPLTLTFLELISGRFSVKIRGDHSEIVMDFNITFQESPGELKVDVSSKSSFNITMTCSMEDAEINSTFIFENNTCRQEGGERSKVTKSGDSLRCYLLNSTIICSNQSSETQNKTTIQPNSTSVVPTKQNDSGLVVPLVVLGLCILGLLVLLGLLAWYIQKKKSYCGGEQSRSGKFLQMVLQIFQHLLGNQVAASQDEQTELNEMSGSQSRTSV